MEASGRMKRVNNVDLQYMRGGDIYVIYMHALSINNGYSTNGAQKRYRHSKERRTSESDIVIVMHQPNQNFVSFRIYT